MNLRVITLCFLLSVTLTSFGQQSWLSVNSTGNEPKEALHVESGGILIEGNRFTPLNSQQIQSYNMPSFFSGFSSDTSAVLFDSGGENSPYGVNQTAQFVVSGFFDGSHFKFTVNSMDLGVGDTIVVVEGDSGDTLAVFTDSVTTSFTGNASGVFIDFKSDDTDQGEGFEMEWQLVSPGVPTTVSTTDPGGLLFWNPRKYALRSGILSGSEWNDVNTGLYSVAFGLNPIASGKGSMAVGKNSSAFGQSSIAMGEFAFAQGESGSVAIGKSVQALGNNGSIAMGLSSRTEGNNGSVAIGSGARAFGDNGAVAIGNNVEASGETSIIIGSRAFPSLFKNNIDNTLMVGFNTTIPTLFVGPGTGVGTLGKVGIGTSVPTSLLTVVGTIETTTGGVKFPDGSIQDKAASPTGWDYTGNSGLNAANFLGTTDAVDLKLVTNNTERMRIDSDGDFGIGTVTPDTKFEISGSGSRYLRITSTDNAEIGLDLVRSGTGNSDYRIANNGGILEIQESANINGVAPTAFYGFTKFALRPDNSTLNLDLGNSGKRWNELFLSGVVHENSDRRLKTDIVKIPYGLREILMLNPVRYIKLNDPDNYELGLIAQEVEEVIPDVVTTPENADEYYSMVYRELIPVLIKSVQELSEKVQKQDERIIELEKELLGLKLK